MSRHNLYMIATCMIILLVGTQAAFVSSINNLSVTSQRDLADILLAHLGKNGGDVSETVKQYIENNKLSILNAVEQVALLLVPDQNAPHTGLTITKDFVAKLGQNFDKVKAHFMNGQTQQEIKNYIEQNLDSTKFHQILVNPAELVKIKSLFSQRRILEQTVIAPAQTTESISYITKFFFIIFFILVLIAGVSAIACMENRKDSLLYAKFIADVGR